jgi:hypothetical protein
MRNKRPTQRPEIPSNSAFPEEKDKNRQKLMLENQDRNHGDTDVKG